MYRELNISESEGVLAAFNAVCELKEETERLQAACAAKEAELAGLRAQTAELFGERLEAEGMDADAVTAAKAMWQHDPESAARAVLDCGIVEAANPYGCNQYGHGFREPHGAAGGRGQKKFDFFGETVDKGREKANSALEKSMQNFRAAYEEREKAEKEYSTTTNWEETDEKWDRAEKELVKQAKEARKQRAEIRRRYKSFELDEADDKLIDEILKGYDDEEEREAASERAGEWLRQNSKGVREAEEARKKREKVKASNTARTLEEMLEEDDLVNAANPYGCNPYGEGWKLPPELKMASDCSRCRCLTVPCAIRTAASVTRGLCRRYGIRKAILTKWFPSCEASGITGKQLRENGIEVINVF